VKKVFEGGSGVERFSCGHWFVTNEFKNKTEYEMQLMRFSHIKVLSL